jgi:hypothetical protein
VAPSTFRRLTQRDICMTIRDIQDGHFMTPERCVPPFQRDPGRVCRVGARGRPQSAALDAQVRLDPWCLSDPHTRIDAAAVAKLLETSAAESQVEDFGLRLSKARRLSNLGPFSLVVREKTTARRALKTLGRYLQLHSEPLSIRIEDAGKSQSRQIRDHRSDSPCAVFRPGWRVPFPTCVWRSVATAAMSC